MRQIFPSVICWALLSLACGGHSTSPTPLTEQAPPTVYFVNIVGPTVVQVGSTAAYTLTASFSAGPPIFNAKAAWTLDNATVATIDGNGRLTANAPGVATIAAFYEGKGATFKIRVPVEDTNPVPGGAHVVISFKPDPAPGSPTTCAFSRRTPSWNLLVIYTETQGVGLTVKEDTLNYYTDDRLLQTITFSEDYYFAPHSEFEEDFCDTLDGAPSGFFEEALGGVDDKGNQVSFISKRLRLLPVTGVSPESSWISPVPPAPANVIRRARHRVR